MKALGIHKDVVQFSKIGNSILEIYVSKDKLQIVRDSLLKIGATILPHCPAHIIPEYFVHASPQQMAIQRMAFLYKATSNRNLRECILRGESSETSAAIVALFHSTEKYKKNTKAAPKIISHDEDASIPADLDSLVELNDITAETVVDMIVEIVSI